MLTIKQNHKIIDIHKSINHEILLMNEKLKIKLTTY